MLVTEDDGCRRNVVTIDAITVVEPSEIFNHLCASLPTLLGLRDVSAIPLFLKNSFDRRLALVLSYDRYSLGSWWQSAARNGA